jgi:hypothetical protein
VAAMPMIGMIDSLLPYAALLPCRVKQAAVHAVPASRCASDEHILPGALDPRHAALLDPMSVQRPVLPPPCISTCSRLRRPGHVPWLAVQLHAARAAPPAVLLEPPHVGVVGERLAGLGVMPQAGDHARPPSVGSRAAAGGRRTTGASQRHEELVLHSVLSFCYVNYFIIPKGSCRYRDAS